MSAGGAPLWSQEDVAGFVASLPRSIPLLGGLRPRLGRCDETGLELVAPLAANHNDKGTAFAGSIATLAVVTGWAVGVLTARALGHEVDVAATRCALDFERPVDGDLHARCRWPDADARSRLQRGLARHGLARLPLEVSVAAEAAGAPGARCVLHYAVRRREDVRASN